MSLVHHRDEQVLFVLEIDVDGALGDAGALGDVIERRHGVAVAREFAERRFEYFLRALRLAAAPASRVGVWPVLWCISLWAFQRLWREPGRTLVDSMTSALKRFRY